MSATNIKLRDEYHDALCNVAARFGKTQQEIVRELVLWLDSVDEEIAGPIIGALPKRLRPDFARMVLQQLAYGDDPKGLGDVTPRPSGDKLRGSGDGPTNDDRQKTRRRQRERPARQDQ